MATVLLTGGMGYIGSHTAVVLIEAGYDVVLYDNLFNSKVSVLDQIEEISNVRPHFLEGDVRDSENLEKVLGSHSIDSVIHFAGLKAVGESVEKPTDYFDHNISGTISLLKAMAATKTEKLVFSSSATVYGEPQYLPLDEGHPTNAVNPYGLSKLHVEGMMKELVDCRKQNDKNLNWKVANLRYFNPVGAHSSGLIGEDPNGIPNNLMPYIMQVASGILPHLNVFGDDYDTPDGTGIRDYIHVMDLAEGHLAALDYLNSHSSEDYRIDTFNLGTGTGYSVIEMVKAFERTSGRSVPYQVTERRPGDIATCYAKTEKANNELQWRSSRDLEEMCDSSWNYITRIHIPDSYNKRTSVSRA